MPLVMVVVLALAVIAARAARSVLSQWVDDAATRSGAKGINWRLMSVLIAFLLLLVVQPEARIFLMFLDAVGLDFFLLILALQCRAYLWILRDQVLIPLWKKIKTAGPVPFDLMVFPTPTVMGEFPFLSACSVAGIVLSVGFMLVLAPVLLAW